MCIAILESIKATRCFIGAQYFSFLEWLHTYVCTLAVVIFNEGLGLSYEVSICLCIVCLARPSTLVCLQILCLYAVSIVPQCSGFPGYHLLVLRACFWHLLFGTLWSGDIILL